MAERDERPLAVACVAVADLRPDVDALTGRVRSDPRALALSASDAAAVEHVLRLAETLALRPLVVAAGPAAVEPALRELAGLGLEARRLAWPPGADGHGEALEDLAGDEAALAAAVASALSAEAGAPEPGAPGAGAPEPGAPGAGAAEVGAVRLAVCGDRSAARGTGAFPAFLAHELGAAQALGLVALEAAPGGALRGERRLEGGRREILEVPLPAVCSVEAAGVRLRRASLPAALAAARAPVRVVPASPPPRRSVRVRGARPFAPRPRPVAAPTGTARERLLGLTGALAEREPPTVVGPVAAEEAAGLLLSYLERAGFASPGAGREP